MGRKLTSRQTRQIAHGLLDISFSVFWLIHFSVLYYKYNYTDILFGFMYTTWILFIYILFSIIGIVFGCQVACGLRSVRNGHLSVLALFIIGLIIDIIYTY